MLYCNNMFKTESGRFDSGFVFETFNMIGQIFCKLFVLKNSQLKSKFKTHQWEKLMKNILVVLSILFVGNIALADGEVEACASITRPSPEHACDNVGVSDLNQWLKAAKEAGAVISYGYCEKEDREDKVRVVFKDAAFFNLAEKSFKQMGLREYYKHRNEVTVGIGPCK